MPYDVLGYYIPGDDEEERRGALASVSLPETIKRMVTSPANDLSPLRSLQTYKDIAGGFASAGESALRGVGSAVLGMTGDMLEHARTTPLIPGVTDKMTLGTVLPGADTLLPTSKYQYTPRREPNVSYPAPREKREVFGIPYATSADLREALPQRYTEPFGDATANAFMEELGVFMSPMAIGAGKKFIEEGLTLASKMPGMTKDAAQAFAMDYANAMNGIYPEIPTAGSKAADMIMASRKVSEPVVEGIKKGASNLEDVTYGNYQRAKVRKAAEGVTPVEEQGGWSPVVERTPDAYESGMPIMAVRKPGGQFVRSNQKPSDLPYGMDLPRGSEFERLMQQYYMRNPTEPGEVFSNWTTILNTKEGYNNDAIRNAPVKPKDLTDAWQDFVGAKAMEAYPDAPNVQLAKRAHLGALQRKGVWNQYRLDMADEFVKTDPDVQ